MVSDTGDRLEFHLTAESQEDSAVELLSTAAKLPKQRIKLAMTQGAVWITRRGSTQRLRRAKRQLQIGDELHLYYDEKVLAEEPPAPELVADVGGYSVWNKPCGLRSQGSKWGDHCTLVRWAERNLHPERSAFTVHRLDRAANGLMMVAHSKTVAAALAELFRRREIEKRYRVLVHGDFSKQPGDLEITSAIDGKPAKSTVSLQEVSADGRQSWLDVQIESGRKHQVRRHLSEFGYPVVGDRLYGAASSDSIDLQLTAYLLAFRCPVSLESVEYRL